MSDPANVDVMFRCFGALILVTSVAISVICIAVYGPAGSERAESDLSMRRPIWAPAILDAIDGGIDEDYQARWQQENAASRGADFIQESEWDAESTEVV